MLDAFGGVSGNDPTELGVACPKMLANDLAENRTIIDQSFEIPPVGRVLRPAGRGRTWHPIRLSRDGVTVGVATIHAVIDRSSGNKHHARFGVVSSYGGILISRAAEFRERYHDNITPINVWTIGFEVLLHGINPPPHSLEQVGLRAGGGALRCMRIKAIKLGARDNGGGMRQDLRSRFEIGIKAV